MDDPKPRYVARYKEGVTYDPSRFLTINQEELVEADFSGRELDSLTVIGSRLVRCRFENLRLDHAVFGAGALPTELVECSFDGTRLLALRPGMSRFERCSFRKVRLGEWVNGFWAEVIDCVFTGRIRRAIFWGAPLSREKDLANFTEAWEHHGRSLESSEYLKVVHRFRNEFRGNDFRDADLVDVNFRKGIDLSLQRLPDKPQYVYLPDAAAALNHVRRAVAEMPEPARSEAANLLVIMEDGISGGQVQLLLRDRKPRYEGDARPVLIDLLRRYVRPADSPP